MPISGTKDRCALCHGCILHYPSMECGQDVASIGQMAMTTFITPRKNQSFVFNQAHSEPSGVRGSPLKNQTLLLKSRRLSIRMRCAKRGVLCSRLRRPPCVIIATALRVGADSPSGWRCGKDTAMKGRSLGGSKQPSQMVTYPVRRYHWNCDWATNVTYVALCAPTQQVRVSRSQGNEDGIRR